MVWELDWRIKLLIGTAIVGAALYGVRPPSRRPVQFALALFGLEVGTLVAVRGVVVAQEDFWWQFAVAYALVLVPGVFVAVILSRLRSWQAAGFNGPRRWRSPHVAALLALTLLLPLLGLSGSGLHRTTTILLALQIAFLALGVFMEEAIYRGLILQVLLPFGPLRACIGSAALFGLSHLDNLFLPGREIAVFYQVFEAFLVGILFGAARLRMNAIWPVMAVHAAYDFVLVLAYGHAVPVVPSRAGFIIATIANLVLAAAGLFLIRKRRTLDVAVS